MLLNLLQRTGWPPATKKDLVQNVISTEVEEL